MMGGAANGLHRHTATGGYIQLMACADTQGVCGCPMHRLVLFVVRRHTARPLEAVQAIICM